MCLTEHQERKDGSEGVELVGITFGDVGTTVLQCNMCNSVDRGEYVMIEHPISGTVLGRVDGIERKTNVSIEKAVELSEGKDVEIEETIIGHVHIIGFRDQRGLLKTPSTPFRAGEKIYFAEEDVIRSVLGLKNDETGAYVGKLRGHDIPVSLNINTIVQKHMSVLAKTGSGKSYTTGVVIEEMMKHDVTMVILDPHGEYASMAKPGDVDSSNDFGVCPRGYGEIITEFSPNPEINQGSRKLSFTFKNMKPTELLDMMGESKRKSNVSALEGMMSRLEAAKGFYTIKDAIALLKRNEEDDVSNLIRGLDELDAKGIFTETGTRMDEIVRDGKTSIITLKGAPPDVQNFVVKRISTALFELRKRNKIPPLLMIAEEAHNFCPQVGKTESSEIFQTIASEGRKFGLGLGIITQRPAKVDKNVLSQCNTQVILKVTNSNDISAIESSVEGITKDMTEEIQRLSIGEAIISGGGLSEPLIIDIRPRESQDGGASIKVV